MSLTLSIIALTTAALGAIAVRRAPAMIKISMIMTRNAGRRRTS